MNKVIFLFLILGLNACSGQFFTPYDQAGRISLQADEKGMQAFSDMLIGISNESHTPQGQKSSYYQLRENQVNWKNQIKAKYSKGGENE